VADQLQILIVVRLLECDGGISAARPLNQWVTNVAVGIARATRAFV